MIIAANFKTNHTRATTKEYINELKNIKTAASTVLVFPPASALNSFELPSNIRVGIQNGYPAKNGSFTGEIGLDQIDEFDLKTILVGHSERRHIMGESQELCAKKFDFYAQQGFEIVYCIGEPKEVREEGIEAVMAYNLTQLEGIDTNYENLIIAYEPVWAIGTGLTASVEQIEETLTLLKKRVNKPLLYGGSVKVANTKEILDIKNCDGILVGTASWDVKSFIEMIKISNQI